MRMLMILIGNVIVWGTIGGCFGTLLEFVSWPTACFCLFLWFILVYIVSGNINRFLFSKFLFERNSDAR